MPLKDRFYLARASAKERLNRRLKMTQHEMQDETGVSRYTIINIEKGKTDTPTDEILKKLANHMRVNTEWLASGKGVMDPELPNFDPSPYLSKLSKKVVHRQSVEPLEGSIARKYERATVIIRKHTTSNRGWKCIIPEVTYERELSVSLSPLIDREAITAAGLFEGDVVIIPNPVDDDDEIYVVKAYY
ncbi:helix-turn-helix domain-containing protein [Sansalvadorimonas verongulae]|uniref:helix-turn-helix domain-containing protein n=1 Tax=Sansalvadorimonas verongulae TaxID=2172824 RepID=UPI0018AD1BA6|nr:helix-turn-helix transcriptional regulator [Sansalvadorimonas verongulae]